MRLLIIFLLLAYPSNLLAIDFRIVAIDLGEDPDCPDFVVEDVNSSGTVVGECTDGYSGLLGSFTAKWTEEEKVTQISPTPLASGLEFFNSAPRVRINDSNSGYAIISTPLESDYYDRHLSLIMEFDLNTNTLNYQPPISDLELQLLNFSEGDLTEILATNISGQHIYRILYENSDDTFTTYSSDQSPLTTKKLSPIVHLFDNNSVFFSRLGSAPKAETGKFCPSFTSKCVFLQVQRFKGAIFAAIGDNTLVGDLNDLNSDKSYRPTLWRQNRKGRWRYQFLNMGRRIPRILKNNFGISAATATNEKGWIGGATITSEKYNGPFLWIPKNSNPSSRLKLHDLSRQFNSYVRSLGFKPRLFKNGRIKAISECGSFVFQTRFRRGQNYDFLFIPDNDLCG